MKEIIGKKVGAIEVLSTFGVMIAALGGAWTSEVYRRPSLHRARPQRVPPENERREVGEGEFGGMKTIIIIPGGDVQFLGDICPVDLPLVKLKRIRVSTIQPLTAPKRCLFRLIRFLFGDQGRIAAWTRRWVGPWKAVILATGQSAVFENRDQAVMWEMRCLESEDF